VQRLRIAPGVFDMLFTVKSPPQLSFRAGQFVTMRVPSGTAEGFLRRSYSIASPAHATDQIRFIVREVPGGRASEYLLSIQPGDEIPMAGPYGIFLLDRSHPGDIVFGATGTGMAAVMPMLEELALHPSHTPSRRLVHWGLRNEEDIFARDEIEELCRRAGATLSLHLSAAGQDWKGHRGRINHDLLKAVPELNDPVFYLVGNGAMIAELKAALIERGVDRKRQIRTESFFD